MKIYGRYEFERLIHKRNQVRDIFAKTEEEIEGKYGFDILKSSKTADKFNIFCYLGIIGLLLYVLLTYKHIENVFVIVGLVILVGLEAYIIFKFIKWMKIEQKFRLLFKEESILNLANKETLEELNIKATKCAIMVICYSENIHMLSNLSSSNRDETLKNLFYKYLKVIDQENNNKATIDDYLSYYYNWESKYL